MRAIKVYIDKNALLNHIPEQYRDCEIIFAKVDNNIDHIEFTAILSNDPLDGSNSLLGDFNNVRRERLNLEYPDDIQ